MKREEMKVQLTSNIRSIANVEINKMNAFFMCGSPTDMPNEGLIAACEHYLEADSEHTADKKDIDVLMEALEKATVLRPGLLQTGTVRNNISDIREVLDNKDVLYASL